MFFLKKPSLVIIVYLTLSKLLCINIISLTFYCEVLLNISLALHLVLFSLNFCPYHCTVMAGINIPLNMYGATVWDLVKTLPEVLNSDLAKDIVQAFANNLFRGPHDLEVLTGYPASKWMDLIIQGVICISPPCQDRRGIGQVSKPSFTYSHEDATSPVRTSNQESLLSNPTHHTTRPPVLSLQNVRGERERVGRYSYSKRPQDDQGWCLFKL